MIAAALGPLSICFIVAISIVLMLVRPRNGPAVHWISAGIVVMHFWFHIS